MPRKARASVGGLVYHVLNRSHSRRRLFYSEKDYAAFFTVLLEAAGNWLSLLNEDQSQRDEERVRISMERNRPLGDAAWVERTVKRLGLEHTVRWPGRPRKGDGDV